MYLRLHKTLYCTFKFTIRYDRRSAMSSFLARRLFSAQMSRALYPVHELARFGYPKPLCYYFFRFDFHDLVCLLPLVSLYPGQAS